MSSTINRRRTLLAALAWCWLTGTSGQASAESPSAPIQVQAQIIARILPFERGFAGRVQGAVLVLIFERSGNADSGSAARQMEKALTDIGQISGKPIRVQTVAYASPASLASECAKRGALALYLTPGFAGESKAIAASLVGAPVLSVAAVEGYVPDGAVLGVEVASGKPRMSINLTQARAQRLDFPSAVLGLAKVYR